MKMRVAYIPRPHKNKTYRYPFIVQSYRNDEGKLIVTISQNSIGNAITELLGVVVRRAPDADAYARAEPALIENLLEVRRRLVAADLGEATATPYWQAA